MTTSHQHPEHTSSEAETTLDQQEKFPQHRDQCEPEPEEPLRKFRNLLNATREGSRLRKENKHKRVDPFQALVYECLPDEGETIPFYLLCILVTGRLHSRFPSKSDKHKISQAINSLENHGMVTSERMSTRELKTQGYNLPGFYCKMIGKKPYKRVNGVKSRPRNES